jgi:hypothetical protein
MERIALANVEAALEHLDWSQGLTRDDVRRAMPHFSNELYLELPSSKRFGSPRELLREALNAGNRAEGDLVREDFDAFSTEGAEDDGGPQAWGEDPILGTHQDTLA